jgi:deoxyribodipyrimidine photolyase
MSKFSYILLVACICLNISFEIVSAKPREHLETGASALSSMSTSKVNKELKYMNILLTILSDPGFLDMNYADQYKFLDEFYNHVNMYLKDERENEEEEKSAIEKELEKRSEQVEEEEEEEREAEQLREAVANDDLSNFLQLE